MDKQLTSSNSADVKKSMNGILSNLRRAEVDSGAWVRFKTPLVAPPNGSYCSEIINQL